MTEKYYCVGSRNFGCLFLQAALCFIIFMLLAQPVQAEINKDNNTLSPVLNIYNWEDYFAADTLADFEKKFGVKVNLETFEDEELVLSALQSYPDKYDVVVVSNEYVRDLIEMRMLSGLNPDNIPNIKNIDIKFRNPAYDHDNKYSVPYLWGTTAIVVNRKFVKEYVSSWSILWNYQYKGKIAMLNSPSELIGSALKLLGYSLNSVNTAELEKATQKLLEQKPLLAGYFDCVTIKDKLISGELWLAQEYSGEAMAAAEKNSDLECIIPNEGTSIWVDNLVIPRDAKHKYTAEVFINYILEPEVSAKIANYLWYANCNIAAKPYTSKEILDSHFLYPAREILDKSEEPKVTGAQEEYNRRQQIINKTWSELNLN